MIQEISEENLYDLVQKEDKVFVYFWADWCFPCRLADSILKGMDIPCASYKINVDQAAGFTKGFGIETVPAYGIFVNGELSDLRQGAATSRQLLEFISNC